MYSLERDPGLADLAFYAAQSIHELRGLEFDESCRGESLVTQVEFKVIKIGLPLGGKRCRTLRGDSVIVILTKQLCISFRHSAVPGERWWMLGSQCL